ncbi:MAG: hypothetical protein QME40_08145, partial [bacterium]|nr:hypothetical protein [bacterium]
DPPFVSLSDDNPTKAESGKMVTIKGEFSDNIGVVSSELTWSPADAVSAPAQPIDFMNKSVDLNISNGFSGQFTYTVEVKDASGNSSTDSGTIYVDDRTKPEITDSTGDTDAGTGDYVKIEANVSDNVGLDKVLLYWVKIDAGQETEVTMSTTGGDIYEATLNMDPNKVGEATYYILARDTSGNFSRDPKTGSYTITVKDNDPPDISIARGDITATTG